jgi:dTDP-4-dehydrorhamnose reductase
MQERDSLNVVNDQIGSPKSRFGKLIMTIITHDHKAGIYNYLTRGDIPNLRWQLKELVVGFRIVK